MPQVFKSAAAVFNVKHPAGKTDWYRIENKAAGPAQVHIYDEIGMWGVSAGQFIADLAAIKGELEVHLNTPGGEVFDGIAIYNALSKRAPTIIIDSLAASIGSVIAMAAKPGGLLMEPTAKMMIHDGFAMGAGNAAELGKLVEQLDSASDTIASIYATRTGKPQADWRAAMREETWYTADAAVAAGIADGVVGQDALAARDRVLITNSASPDADVTTDADGTQHHRWDPDGDGDDDSTPEGDTDHSHWSANGTQLKPVPGKPLRPNSTSGSDAGTDTGHDVTDQASTGHELTDFLVSALRDAAATVPPVPAVPAVPDGQVGLDYSPWNPAQAWHNAASSANPAAFYAGICAGKRDGDPGVQSSWALPYRYEPGGPANVDGVRQALDRLVADARLTNTAEARSLLLAAHNAAELATAADQLGRASAAVAALSVPEDPAPAAPGGGGGGEYATSAGPVIRFGDSVDRSPWNAAKAWHNGATAADSAAFYAGICAGEKPGDKATQAAWSLPYRYTPTSPPNADGVKAALARLSSTEGLTNASAAKSKLQGLMKQVNPDYEPDDLAELFRSVHHVLNGVTDAG